MLTLFVAIPTPEAGDRLAREGFPEGPPVTLSATLPPGPALVVELDGRTARRFARGAGRYVIPAKVLNEPDTRARRWLAPRRPA